MCLICKAEDQIGNVRVTGKSQPVYVNAMKILLVQTFTQAEWEHNCNTCADEFVENVYDKQTDKYVFVRVELEILAERSTTISMEMYANRGLVWFGVHKDDVKKLGL